LRQGYAPDDAVGGQCFINTLVDWYGAPPNCVKLPATLWFSIAPPPSTMYNERFRLEFLETVPLSARFRLLAELASHLEQAGPLSEHSPGFSIEIKSNGRLKVDIWHPEKRDALFSQLRAGEEMKLLRVTDPKGFSGWSKGGE
jgi:hypothetical protein